MLPQNPENENGGEACGSTNGLPVACIATICRRRRPQPLIRIVALQRVARGARESRAIHEVAERLFRERATQNSHAFELRHKAIIDRFGRYPHRNEVLGRVSTPEERDFLTQPGSRF